jgi:hypothetical protein
LGVNVRDRIHGTNALPVQLMGPIGLISIGCGMHLSAVVPTIEFTHTAFDPVAVLTMETVLYAAGG